MNEQSDTLIKPISVEQLEDHFNQHLSCQITYSDCAQEPVWMSNGACPQCHETSLRFICSVCHQNIIAGGRMKHDSCGYRGQSRDFFKEFRPI